MASSNIYRVIYQFIRAGSGAGSKYGYRSELRTAHVAAANPGAVLGVLAANVTNPSAATAGAAGIEIIQTMQEETTDGVIYS